MRMWMGMTMMRKNANSFLGFVCVCVRWLEDVCVRDVESR